jgi:hypothetical protein
MQIHTASRQAAPAAPTPQLPDLELRHGDDPARSISAGINEPAYRFVRVYTAEMHALMGNTSVATRNTAPDTVFLRFMNEDFARLARGVLRDTVLGAKLVYTDRAGKQFDFSGPAADWASYPSNFARNVAAMPGVVRYRINSAPQYVFFPESPETRVKLQQLVRPQLDDRFRTYWMGQCSGSSCPPQPVPPDGWFPPRTRA